MPDPEILFYPDAARMLRRGVETLRKDVMKGLIPHHKPYGPRGRVVFFKNELEDFVRSAPAGGST